jgi:hypothetical protein
MVQQEKWQAFKALMHFIWLDYRLKNHGTPLDCDACYHFRRTGYVCYLTHED